MVIEDPGTFAAAASPRYDHAVASKADQPLTYRDAGVDIDRGNRLVDAIKPVVERTRRPGVLAGLGGFGGMFEIPAGRYRNPVLVSGTDGVGTKLRLAIDAGIHDTVGIDLVAMCANDILVLGAEPLFFLDYFATGHLDVDVARQVIEGIGRGCEQAGAALLGGETAEMPGIYAAEDYDLAGFCVGAVEKDAIIDGRSVSPGDAVIGLGSSGLHSNGYSLARAVIKRSGADLSQAFEGRRLGEVLLEPTRIYVKPILALLRDVPVRALAHITGGGLVENIPRALPEDTVARLDTKSWNRPAVFDWLQREGRIANDEMGRTFNCGIGMVIVVAEPDTGRTLEHLRNNGEEAWAIGVIESATDGEPRVLLT